MPPRLRLTAPPLILSRPEAQSRRFALEARRAGIDGAILISPVLQVHLDPPAALPPGDLVLSSVHGVAAARDLSGRRVWAVGAATARAALAAGADLQQTAPDIAALATLLLAARPERVVHLRGTHVAGSLIEDLSAAGIRAEGITVYDQAARRISDAARRAIAAGPVLLPLFSPRSAALLGAEVDGPPVAARVLAISAAAARAWPWPGEVRIAARPDGRAMLDGLRGLVDREGDR
ncbi:uroporphyrinogen-III synthase [Palleronia aestuarii]|uniref:Uroporphyrinogen-III synthase n=1 Tax=Palleronia aestuarii TaxID=568105 RepID=A0A2W7NEZ9_9RHOB|nr:uroporphyrinogen-III synthase [Palleronia aestuarii]PZX19005.1 uroporphyrinogen-III synthase [Palleronia aestuarii]